MSFVKRASANLYPWAECLTCTEEWPHGSRTRDLAKHHGRTRGHKVRIVQENVDLWAPTDYDESLDLQHREEL